MADAASVNRRMDWMERFIYNRHTPMPQYRNTVLPLMLLP